MVKSEVGHLKKQRKINRESIEIEAVKSRSDESFSW